MPMPSRRPSPMFGWGPRIDPVVTDEVSGDPCPTCCQPTFHTGCAFCKGTGEIGDPTFRRLNQFSWSVEVLGVTTASTETLDVLCERYKSLYYPPDGTGAPFPCVGDDTFCDTYGQQCSTLNRTYGPISWSGGAVGPYYSPWCGRYTGGTPGSPVLTNGSLLFNVRDACAWSATVYADLDPGLGLGDFDYFCTGLSIGVQFMRTTDGELKLGARAYTCWGSVVCASGSNAVYGFASRQGDGVLDLTEDEDGLVDCEDFEETVSISPHYTCAGNQLWYGDAWHDADLAVRCGIPSAIKLIGTPL